jgi:hypothetical protein
MNKYCGLIDQPVCEDDLKCQKPQAPEDRQAPGYDNDVKSNWLRGMGPGEAEGKPGFDKKRSG